MPRPREPAARSSGEKEAWPADEVDSGQRIDSGAPREAPFPGGYESAAVAPQPRTAGLTGAIISCVLRRDVPVLMNGLVKIAPPRFDVILALAYATAENLTSRRIYGKAACFLHRDAAALLDRAIDLAAVQGLKLKIFDGYRPVEAQWALWRHCPDPTFLADPRRGSPHSRGVAVDLTLVHRKTREELEMGTGFDDLTPRAFHGSAEPTPEARRNRMLLLGLMASAGWDHYLNEWWHYQLFAPRRYPLLWDSAAGTGLMAS